MNVELFDSGPETSRYKVTDEYDQTGFIRISDDQTLHADYGTQARKSSAWMREAEAAVLDYVDEDAQTDLSAFSKGGDSR